eukprot:scaffold144003_cov244-Phaeocystis_antarctica.AAC.1
MASPFEAQAAAGGVPGGRHADGARAAAGAHQDRGPAVLRRAHRRRPRPARAQVRRRRADAGRAQRGARGAQHHVHVVHMHM